MSQAVFARGLHLTVGYISRPTGPALALSNLIERKGINAIL
jgi:putative transcriptional regulator